MSLMIPSGLEDTAAKAMPDNAAVAYVQHYKREGGCGHSSRRTMQITELELLLPATAPGLLQSL